MDLDHSRREERFFHAAVGIYEDETADDTVSIGTLRLSREDDYYRVNRVHEDGDVTYIDSIRPQAFKSARYLGGYVLELDSLIPPPGERKDPFFLACVEVFEGEIAGDTLSMGTLRLYCEGDYWRVNHLHEEGIEAYTDTVRPGSIRSARYLGRLLLGLDSHEVDEFRAVQDPSKPGTDF